ncbi:hypothetical protein DSM112329_04656 [Paraconexibacter sp. AEG42_29]|uniref:Insecticide toxin TcdB middle/N-terminal domain-containing protein n=2 Tax=Paraconexibacter sp. AEG42_29 TaxID=2997339 RepID=A0AAU7B181_9ACTN
MGSGAVVLAALAALPTTPAPARDNAELLGANASTLVREPMIRPAGLGTDPIEKLRYGNPTEGIDLVTVPEASPSGDAELTLPMSIPAGRGGVQPDLTLGYNSSGGPGWVGTGWDLDLGSIEVDTGFGVPRYDEDLETETYTLDGDQLAPNAIRTEFLPRDRGRADFTRRVDTEGDLIIRHGDDPTDYWWEVRDKLGGIRWYGGYPDTGGFDGVRVPGRDLDERAVLRTKPGGPIYRWGLTAVRDVGVNLMRIRYQKVSGERVGRDQESRGTQMYPREVLYTARSDESVEDDTGDPAWKVVFLRDDDIDPQPTPRKDVIVDASGGFLQVTSDLLRRIEVRTGVQNDDGSLRDFTTLSKAFDLHYTEGAFGKAILTKVDQRGTDNTVFAHNDLDYFDDARDSGGGYEGFEGEASWDTGNDGLATDLLSAFGSSALGATESDSGDASAFVGFNPTSPTKNLAIGGSVSVSGGAGRSTIEFLDINGDSLPDKVYRKGPGDVRFRLNTSGPSGSTTFGPSHGIDGLSALSTDFDIGINAGPEAYVGVFATQFSTGGSVSVGEDYFADVNADGLPDYVTSGKVLFNHLEGGVPTFEDTSDGTKVPIGERDLEVPDIEKLDELEQVQRDNSPVQDTVRRWVAPYAGTVDIDAPVTFDPPPDTRTPPVPDDDGDGVRVSVQRGDDVLWSDTLTTPGSEATPTDVDDVHVNRGQAIYFRLQTGDDAARDQVRWDPEIHYDDFDESQEGPGRDVNGRLERTYRASGDFTLAGRPAVPMVAPLDGVVRFEATLRKPKLLTDQLAVVVQKNGVDVLRRVIPDRETHPDGLSLSANIPVVAPTDTTADKLSVRLEVDTDVDVASLDFKPRLFYTSAQRDGQTIPTNRPDGSLALEIPVLPYIDLYPSSSAVAPPEGVAVIGTGVRANVVTNGAQPGTRVVLSLKSSDGLVAKKAATISSADQFHQTPITIGPDEMDRELDGPTWIDLTFADPSASAILDDATKVTELIGGIGQSLPFTTRFQGPQGFFPLPYRGWGYAGYSSTGAIDTPLDEDAFTFREDDFPKTAPTGWSVTAYPDPSRGRAYPFIPYSLPLTNAAGQQTGTADVWRGAKDNIVGGATFARASRRGVDDPSDVQGFQPSASEGAGVSAPRRVGVSAPQFSFNAAALQLNGSFGGTPSYGLVDYMDLNGDGFPDVVTPDNIEYTGPRGAFYDDNGDHDYDAPAIVRQDSMLGFGAGFAGSAISPKGDDKGQGGTSSGDGKSTKSGRSRRIASQVASSFNLGGSFGLETSFSNPSLTEDAVEELPSTAAPTLESDYADVNGDGLADRIEASPTETTVSLNLGYSFAAPIAWSNGGFEAGVTISGALGIAPGFQYNKREFAGGLSYNEGVSLAQTTWSDVNGDGILDRLTKQPDTNITVAFGTGAGLMEDTDYGRWTEGTIGLQGVEGIRLGEQIVQDRSRSLGGGLDFTFGIGPLCTFLCYIVVNPGLHYDREVGNTTVDLIDVDGDGAPDSVSSLADDSIQVRRNRVGRSNLLRSVSNSIGGELRLNYKRAGNTEKNPDGQWALASVQVDDGHAGDGTDVELRTFEYEDGVFDALERQPLGYGKVTETVRDFRGDGNPADDPQVQRIERTYRNATVFDAGLPTREKVFGADGKPVRESVSTWVTAELENATAVDALAIARNERLRFSLSPRRTKLEERSFAADGSVGQETWNDFRHDELGNVIWQHDEGAPENDQDDLIAVTRPSDCTTGHLQDEEDDGNDPDEDPSGFVCGVKLPEGRISPLFDLDRCATWTSIPAEYTVTDGDGKVLRHRDGSPELCDNSSVTHLVEDTGPGTAQAITNLEYDDWGSYNKITYPGVTEAARYGVEYVYDANTHSQVASVKDTYGLQASATFDGATGRITSRTAPNGAQTRYAYDPQHRLRSVTAPGETKPQTIQFEYRTLAQDPLVIARHSDPARPGDPIETVAFADGRGRVTQTKRDATVTGDPAPANVMVVEGAFDRDALDRTTRTFQPTEEPVGSAHVFNPVRSTVPPTQTAYDDAGRVRTVTYADGGVVRSDHAFGSDEGTGGTKARQVTVTDQEQKVKRTSTSARGDVLAVEERGTGAGPVRRTRYGYDALGTLTTVVEPGGGTTTHTYDQLGRRRSTRTPDAGLTELRYDAASNLVAKVTPKTRATSTQIAYSYDQERLLAVDYPDAATPDVTYAWGPATGPANARGRVVKTTDGARDRTVEYDAFGRVTSETALMKVPGYDVNAITRAANTYVTSFTADLLGRQRTVTYPDGEVVTNGYDAGGLLNRVEGKKGGQTTVYVDRLEYDRFGAKRLQVNGNGTRSTQAYSALTRRLQRKITTTPTREVQDLNYTYDLVGNVKRLNNDLPPLPAGATSIAPGYQNYTYDDSHRLAAADGFYTEPNSKTRKYTTALTYDLAGNLASRQQTDQRIGPGTSTSTLAPTSYSRTYTYDPATAHRVKTSAGRTLTYDADGNLTGWAVSSFGLARKLTWDTAGTMRSAADRQTATYVYDAEGQLAIQTGPVGRPVFVNPWYTVDTTANKLTKNIFAGRERLLTKIVAPTQPELGQRWLHTDLQGSVTVITDDKGAVRQHTEYFPGGEPWIVDGPETSVSYQYAGTHTSLAGDMVNLGVRWYDPRDSLFTAPDPLLADDPAAVIEDPRLLPAYTYAESNPLRFVDPAGTDAEDAQATQVAALGAAGAAPATEGGEAVGPGLGIRPGERPYVATPRAGSRIDRVRSTLEPLGTASLFSYGKTKGKDGKKRFDVSFAPALNNLSEFSLRNAPGNIRSGFNKLRRAFSSGKGG